MKSRLLRVPYFVQPDGKTCQSTCLKMMAAYLEQAVVFRRTGAGDEDIHAIWKDINESAERPVKGRNAHANMKWWLERHFPSLRFQYLPIFDEAQALESVIRFLDGGVPVLMSVSHARSEGHIVLVVGYENYSPLVSSSEFNLVVHDPNGRFDPTLLSRLYGGKRREGGTSTMAGAQTGPGQHCRLAITRVSRQREGDPRRGTYYLLSTQR